MRSIDYKKVVAHKISIARSELNLNQTEFGELLGVGQGQVAKLESGTNNPEADTIAWIAQQTKKTPAWFFEPMPRVDYSPDSEAQPKKARRRRDPEKEPAR